MGVRLMARGGGAVWNAEVAAMLAPLAKDYSLELAFGMAEVASLEGAVKKLEASGADRNVVVRLAPFKKVQAETLLEDWREKRVVSETRIGASREAGSKDGGRVIVIACRVAGFGPYSGVLKDLNNVADSKGLLPSTGIEHWIRRQVNELATKGQFRKLPQA